MKITKKPTKEHLNQLNDLLIEAIDEEDDEKAALIRHEISELRKKYKSPNRVRKNN